VERLKESSSADAGEFRDANRELRRVDGYLLDPEIRRLREEARRVGLDLVQRVIAHGFTALGDDDVAVLPRTAGVARDAMQARVREVFEDSVTTS
jgi:hypothetical protein